MAAPPALAPAAAACAAAGASAAAALGFWCGRRRAVVPPPTPSPSPGTSPARWREVVAYWFESEPTAKLQHRLWFCGEGSERQGEVDAYITEEFAGLLDAAEKDAWVVTPASATLEILAYVITVDQLSRHIYRERARGDGAGCCTKPPASTDARALRAAEMLHGMEEAWRTLTSVQLTFSLLPYRHHKAAGDVEVQKACHRRALELLQRVEAKSGDDAAVLQRFRTATVRRYQALCDIRDPGEGICEREEFTPTPEVKAQLPKETLVRTTARFLLNQGPAFAAEGIACVSLSGGVDSMVIADIFCHLRDHPRPVERARKGQYTGAADRRMKHNILETQTAGLVKKVTGVHIHYGNREESQAEADFLRDWCERRGIELTVKSITDLKRATADREEYEELTRNIRFDEYRAAMARGVRGVCLGHHAGDVVENLLSNANRGSGILEMSGMKEASAMEDVPVWRPLLRHNKDEILAYAHKYGVPYFNDTTPTWSTRGKLRRNLLPCISDTYGAGSAANLHGLALDSDAMKALVYSRLIDPFLKTRMRRRRYGVEVGVSGDVQGYGRLFWKEVFKTVQHGVFHTAMLSDSALRDISVRLALTGFEDGDEQYITAPQDGWVEPKKNMFWYLAQGTLFIPTPNMLSARFKTAPPLVIGAGPQRVGHWEITARVHTLHADEAGDDRYTDHRSLPKPCRVPPFTDPAPLLDGGFSYFMVVPADIEQLSWQDAPGMKPPWCWKQVHMRYHTALPIACAPPVISDARKVVKVSYQYVEAGAALLCEASAPPSPRIVERPKSPRVGSLSMASIVSASRAVADTAE